MHDKSFRMFELKLDLQNRPIFQRIYVGELLFPENFIFFDALYGLSYGNMEGLISRVRGTGHCTVHIVRAILEQSAGHRTLYNPYSACNTRAEPGNHLVSSVAHSKT